MDEKEELKKRIKTLERQKAALEESNRSLLELNEINSDLMLRLDYELREPLTLLKGHACLLGDMCSKISETISETDREFYEEKDFQIGFQIASKRVSIIENQINTMINIITKFRNALVDVNLLMLEDDDVKKEELSLEELIETKKIEWEERENRQIRLEIDKLPFVFGNRFGLETVLDEIIGNAIRYSKKEILIKANPEGDFVHVSIKDRGIGIAEGNLENIFKRFYQKGNEVRKRGFGLGLSVIRSIIGAHNGKIWAESELGSYTIIHFVIPIAHTAR